MKHLYIRPLAGLLLGFCLAGCATPSRISVRVLKPATLDIPGVRKVAVVDFVGPERSGSQIASRVQSMLMESERFDIVERDRISRVLEEQDLATSAVADDAAAVEMGRLLGVDALVFGEVTRYEVPPDQRIDRKVREQRFTGRYRTVERRDRRTGEVRRVRERVYEDVWVDKPYWIRQGTVDINFRMVDVESGRLLAAFSDSRSYDSQREERRTFLDQITDEQAALKPRGEILNDLALEIVKGFVRLVAPYYVYEVRVIEPGRGLIDAGRSFAKNGLWPEAMNTWEQAMREMPDEPAAFYNFGLACEVQGMLQRAEEAYAKALELAPKDLYMRSLARVRQTIRELEK